MQSINIIIDERYYSKDPFSSELGRRIVEQGLTLINELGFENFTFRKLADSIGSTEASIYRYFENKQKLLIYLTAWYWSWAEYQIDYDTHLLPPGRDKLNRAWEILCHLSIATENVAMDVSALRKIVIKESDKTFLNQNVDAINSEGLYLDLKSLCDKIAHMILEISPDYSYPHTLVSTLIEASHQQYFFALHLPSLTEIKKQSDDEVNRQVQTFIMDTLDRIIEVKKEPIIP